MGGSDKVPLTVCVIAQDAEESIGRCLRSAAFAADLLVLDGGSADRTRDVAAAAGARVEERAFDGWISQKNAALERARHDWVLALDADEEVSAALRDEIVALFRSGDPPCSGYDAPRRAWHLGRWIRGGGWYPDRKLRLFRRSLGRWGGLDPHDRVEVLGRVGRLRGEILHYPYRDLFDHLRRLDRYTTAAARAAFQSGRRFALARMVAAPPLRFLKAYLWRGGFRDGRVGLVLAAMAGAYELMRYAKLWDLERRERGAA